MSKCILCGSEMQLLTERAALPASDAFSDPVFDLYYCAEDETRSWFRRWTDAAVPTPESVFAPVPAQAPEAA